MDIRSRGGGARVRREVGAVLRVTVTNREEL
jgi:hypothetical protein